MYKHEELRDRAVKAIADAKTMEPGEARDSMLAKAKDFAMQAKAAKSAYDNKQLDDLEEQATSAYGANARRRVLRNEPYRGSFVEQMSRRLPDQAGTKALGTFGAPRLEMDRSFYEGLGQTGAEIGEKALAEGNSYTGAGVLVAPEYAQDLFATKRYQSNALRAYGWLNVRAATSNLVTLPRQLTGSTVGWTAEGALKPTGDPTFDSISIPIYVLAGLGKFSVQLLQDRDPSAQEMLFADLARNLGNGEEQAIYSGTGTGQPLGILNSPGVPALSVAASPTAQTVFDAICDAITTVVSNFQAMPTGIMMTPKRLAFLRKGKDTQGNYLLNPTGQTRAPGGANPGGIVSANDGTMQADTPTIWNVPVVQSTNVPANLGAGTDEDVIIVANWEEAHWFERQTITLRSTDVSDTTFDYNQVKIRAEERAGFTAERYPTAFCVVGGPGLV